MRRFILGVFCFFAVVVTAAWFTLKQSDIPYAELESRYSVSASRFVTLPSGARVHYLDSGPATNTKNKQVLVLLHDYSSSAFEWNDWIKELRGRTHIIAVDLPAHGMTNASMNYIRDENGMSNFVDEFTTSLNLKNFALGGSSLGGKIAWQYSLSHPNKVKALILIGADGWPKSDSQAFDPIIKDLRLHHKMAHLLKYMNVDKLITARMDRSFTNPDEVTPEQIKRACDLTLAPDHRKGLVELALNETFLDPQQSNPIPVLILQGEKDAIIPLDFARKFHALAPNSTLLTYEMSGHYLNQEAPRRSLEDTLYFLNDTRLERPQVSTQALESEFSEIGTDMNKISGEESLNAPLIREASIPSE